MRIVAYSVVVAFLSMDCRKLSCGPGDLGAAAERLTRDNPGADACAALRDELDGWDVTYCQIGAAQVTLPLGRAEALAAVDARYAERGFAKRQLPNPAYRTYQRGNVEVTCSPFRPEDDPAAPTELMCSRFVRAE